MKGPRQPPPEWTATLAFNCPWRGHEPDTALVIRNSAMPNLIGTRCVKCASALYFLMEQSQIIGADGAPLPKA